MNQFTLLERLRGNGLITTEQFDLMDSYLKQKPFSIYLELRVILFLGILMLTSGLGVIVYDNIDTIGHKVILVVIGLVSALCFAHAYINKAQFSWDKVQSTNKLSDYSLLIGCSTLLLLLGYAQYQYEIFGTRYGLGVAIPTLIFFFCAYYFDHSGVLSMAITGLASWLGLTVAPLSVITKNDFTDPKLLFTAIVLGAILLGVAWVSQEKDIKKHFSFTYVFLGGNLAATAALTGLFNHNNKWIYFIVSILLAAYFVVYARKNQAGLILLMGVIYGYIATTYLLTLLPDEVFEFIGIWYFLLSSAGVLYFLLNFKKILRTKK